MAAARRREAIGATGSLVLTAVLSVAMAQCAPAPRPALVALTSCDSLVALAPDARLVAPMDEPKLLNDSLLGEEARALYPTQWTRFTSLRGVVQPDGRLSHVCVDLGSGDSDYDRAVLTTAAKAAFQPTVVRGVPAAVWTSFTVHTRVEGPPLRDGRYGAIANPWPIREGTLTDEGMKAQAAILTYLFRHNASHDEERPNQAICVGIGRFMPVLDAPPPLMALLGPGPVPVHPATDCEVDEEHRYRGSRHVRLVLAGTDAPAIALWVDIAEPTGDAVEVRAGYFEAGLSAADYRCRAIRSGGEWVVVRCTVTAIA